MASNVQHADAIRLVQNLEEQILKDPNYHMTYSDAAAVHSLGDDAATLQWQKIERFGEKGVQKALGLSANIPTRAAGQLVR